MNSSRRTLTKIIGLATMGSLFRSASARSQTRSVTIGITLPLTGSGAEDAVNILHGAVLAIEEANAAGGPGGYRVQIETLDNATATAG
jgi:ABC-type branched-subunit amino acid transport system substrate-binding protein